MNYLCLIFLIFYFVFMESGKIRQNFDEIFGEGWNNKNEREEEMETEQNKQLGNMEFEQMGDENGTYPNDQQKREIILKFDAIKEKLKEKRIYHWKYNNKIECKIGKLLGTNRKKIYKWKKEMNLNKKKMNRMKMSFYEKKKKEFIKRIDEFKSFYGQRKQKQFVKDLDISKQTFTKWKKELLPKYNKTQFKYSNEEKLSLLKQVLKIKDKSKNQGPIHC